MLATIMCGVTRREPSSLFVDLLVALSSGGATPNVRAGKVLAMPAKVLKFSSRLIKK
jgi:hypothetical protein